MNMPVHDSGIVFSGSLPLQVDLLSEAPREQELQRANESNDLLLKSVAVLEEKAEHDEGDPIALELKRQDLKLNLILDLLVSLMQQQRMLPEPRELQLTAAGLRLLADQKSIPAQPCRVQLYIEHAIPKPLTLFGLCHSSSQAGMTDIQFVGVSQSVMDNIDKFIFRQHRRRIAQARKA